MTDTDDEVTRVQPMMRRYGGIIPALAMLSATMADYPTRRENWHDDRPIHEYTPDEACEIARQIARERKAKRKRR